MGKKKVSAILRYKGIKLLYSSIIWWSIFVPLDDLGQCLIRNSIVIYSIFWNKLQHLSENIMFFLCLHGVLFSYDCGNVANNDSFLFSLFIYGLNCRWYWSAVTVLLVQYIVPLCVLNRVTMVNVYARSLCVSIELYSSKIYTGHIHTN